MWPAAGFTISVQLRPETLGAMHFVATILESSEFMERAIGIEPNTHEK